MFTEQLSSALYMVTHCPDGPKRQIDMFFWLKAMFSFTQHNHTSVSTEPLRQPFQAL